MEVITVTPRLAVLGTFPLQKDVEIREMVALGNAEIGMDIVSFFFLLSRTIKNLFVMDRLE